MAFLNPLETCIYRVPLDRGEAVCNKTYTLRIEPRKKGLITSVDEVDASCLPTDLRRLLIPSLS